MTTGDQLPLQAAVLCCTSLPQDVRTRLVEVAMELGATHTLDLTCDVTHLIVGNIATPKYRYVAKDRPDIKVVHQSWVEAVRQSWIEGGEVDVKDLEEQHKSPVFFGLKICVTGFDDHEQRNLISDTVQQEGAEYHPDLTKKVTHLIAAYPQGAKYTHAKQWGISIVSWKWYADSIRRGMALDEALYDPAMSEEEQGQAAYRTEPKPRTSLGKRPRESETLGGDEAGKRKMRRTASTRLSSHSQDMWQDLSARDSTLDHPEADQWNNKEENRERSLVPSRPSIAKIQVRQSDFFQPQVEREHGCAQDGILSGAHVLIRGFPRDKRNRLTAFLEPNGACVVQSASELESASGQPFFRSRYLLVPHILAHGTIELPDVPAGTEQVTEWWVERCIHYKHFFDPTEDVLSRPFWNAKISGFDGLTIATTGFIGVTFRQTAEMIKLLGATYKENFAPSVSVLISSSDSVKKEKAYYASKHSIPVVSAGWLWKCLEMGKVMPYENFRINVSVGEPEPRSESSATGSGSVDLVRPRLDTLENATRHAPATRLSNTRKKHFTPSLPLQTTKPSLHSKSRRGPFVLEDDDDDESHADQDGQSLSAPTPMAHSPRRSQPLQALSPNASPRKSVRPQLESDKVEKDYEPDTKQAPHLPITAPQSPRRNTSPPKDIHPPPRPRPHDELTANLASIIQQQISSRTDSETPLPKRNHRPLGRSASNIGLRSASMQSDTTSTPDKEASLPPSTQLGYETPDAEQHRALVEKRMKVTLRDEESERRVASIGTVKDGVADGGAGGGRRVSGRNRTKT